ncbi:MAG: hypothetical protein A3A61_01885 [Candidatus Woykebacteria bacterium RIFCSPLOWO2_01_FULL_43_14]|uniref:Uncharacterized protein n=1 Tax=Candidatus Woykebacteria bacterium RIFCSPLOWO2_01_FULL_43_14 TaxID=1802605 RepID=A0A1G1WTE2_9BACT|nr:MAG: hypothetical protein A3A61_01885 [Candidatus Woykebacteria bacterium RIFCSPLOWO2_01_FULL_43_14]
MKVLRIGLKVLGTLIEFLFPPLFWVELAYLRIRASSRKSGEGHQSDGFNFTICLGGHFVNLILVVVVGLVAILVNWFTYHTVPVWWIWVIGLVWLVYDVGVTSALDGLLYEG